MGKELWLLSKLPFAFRNSDGTEISSRQSTGTGPKVQEIHLPVSESTEIHGVVKTPGGLEIPVNSEGQKVTYGRNTVNFSIPRDQQNILKVLGPTMDRVRFSSRFDYSSKGNKKG